MAESDQRCKGEARGTLPNRESSFCLAPTGQPEHIPTLGTIVGAYKLTVSRLVNGLQHSPGTPVWQRNYYDHIIRNEVEFNHLWDYIDDNPRKWEEDQLFHL